MNARNTWTLWLSVLVLLGAFLIGGCNVPGDDYRLCDYTDPTALNSDLDVDSQNVLTPVSVSSDLTLTVASAPAGIACDRALNTPYVSAESSNPDVLAVEDTEGQGWGSITLSGRSAGNATITIEVDESDTITRTFTVKEPTGNAVEVIKDDYLIEARKRGLVESADTLAVLPEARIVAMNVPLLDGERMLGAIDTQFGVTGAATMIDGFIDAPNIAEFVAPASAGSFAIQTERGGAKNIDVIPMTELDRIEGVVFANSNDFYERFVDGDSVTLPAERDDFVLQLLPVTADGTYVHGTGGELLYMRIADSVGDLFEVSGRTTDIGQGPVRFDRRYALSFVMANFTRDESGVLQFEWAGHQTEVTVSRP